MKTAEEHRADEARHLTEQERSRRESDTDGFVSQWASGINASLARAKATIAEEGGTADFPGLYRKSDGKRMQAKHVSWSCKYSHRTKWGWSFRDGSDLFLPDTRTARGKMAKAGYEVRTERAPANAVLAGSGTGLSGQVWVEVYRTDDGYPDDAVAS
jgi:hypothetical protein